MHGLAAMLVVLLTSGRLGLPVAGSKLYHGSRPRHGLIMTTAVILGVDDDAANRGILEREHAKR